MEDPGTTCGSKHDYAHLGLAAVFVSYSQPESGAFLLKTQAVENKISLQFFFSFSENVVSWKRDGNKD